jgi:hypothetical protein
MANGVAIGPDSRLDPFFQVEGTYQPEFLLEQNSGGARSLLSANGDRFSFRYSVSNDRRSPSTFEYVNHSQAASFQMSCLIAVSFTHSRSGGDDHDIVTFAGYGDWSRDRPDAQRLATVQVSSAKSRRYVSIMIDGGRVSNVNTIPDIETPPLTGLCAPDHPR